MSVSAVRPGRDTDAPARSGRLDGGKELGPMHRPIRIVRIPRPGDSKRSDRLRTPADAAEIARRVAIYAEQVERTGQIAWLPHRDTQVDLH